MKGRVTVMDLVMEVVMMVIKAAKEILYVEATIVRNLVPTIMTKTIVVKNPQNINQLKNQNYFSQLCWSLHQVRDALVEIIKEEDVAHQRILVMKERVTVMDLVMEVVMMVIKAAKEILYVEATIARNLVHTIMKKMTVVKNPQNINQL